MVLPVWPQALNWTRRCEYVRYFCNQSHRIRLVRHRGLAFDFRKDVSSEPDWFRKSDWSPAPRKGEKTLRSINAISNHY